MPTTNFWKTLKLTLVFEIFIIKISFKFSISPLDEISIRTFLQGAGSQFCMCQIMCVCESGRRGCQWGPGILLSFIYVRTGSFVRWLEYYQFAQHSSGIAKINYNKTTTTIALAATFIKATTMKLWQQFDLVNYLYAEMNF